MSGSTASGWLVTPRETPASDQRVGAVTTTLWPARTSDRAAARETRSFPSVISTRMTQDLAQHTGLGSAAPVARVRHYRIREALASLLHHGPRMSSVIQGPVPAPPAAPAVSPPTSPPLPAPTAAPSQHAAVAPDTRAGPPDLLIACITIYLATAVGRLHEVFPVLSHLKPTMLSAVLAIGLYSIDRSRLRAPRRLFSRTTLYLVALVGWGALSVPGALNQGAAFHGWLALLRSALMCFVVAGSVRRTADVERLALVYFVVTAVYVGVVLSRFQLGSDNWRLARLYYYDANDLAT